MKDICLLLPANPTTYQNRLLLICNPCMKKTLKIVRPSESLHYLLDIFIVYQGSGDKSPALD